MLLFYRHVHWLVHNPTLNIHDDWLKTVFTHLDFHSWTCELLKLYPLSTSPLAYTTVLVLINSGASHANESIKHHNRKWPSKGKRKKTERPYFKLSLPGDVRYSRCRREVNSIHVTVGFNKPVRKQNWDGWIPMDFRELGFLPWGSLRNPCRKFQYHFPLWPW